MLLYVSSDLRWFAEEDGSPLAKDLVQGDADRRRIYRRADATWINWLAHQVARAGDRLTTEQREAWAWILGLARCLFPGLDLSAPPSTSYQPPGIPAARK